MWLSVFILLLLLTFSAFISASETSLFSLPNIRLRTYAYSKNSRKRMIAQILSKPQDLIVTLLMFNISANLLLQNIVASIFSSFSSWLLNVVIPLILVLVFGEVLPKAFAFSHSEFFAYRIAPLTHALFLLFSPVRIILTKITDPISRFLFFFLTPARKISKEELAHVVDRSELLGILSHQEASFIEGYLELSDLFVKEFMQPRDRILFYDMNQPIEELFSLVHKNIRDKTAESILICRETLDQVQGILLLRKFFSHSEQAKRDFFSLLEKPKFIPELSPAKELLHLYQKNETFSFLVVDEYGVISGTVTDRDLIQIIMGDVAVKTVPYLLYFSPEKQIIIADGRLDIDHVEKVFSVSLPNPYRTVTLGGWLTERMGDIPSSGSVYYWDYVENDAQESVYRTLFFQIIEVSDKRLKKIYIRKKNRSS